MHFYSFRLEKQAGYYKHKEQRLFPTQDTKHSYRPSKYRINDGLTPLNEISKVATKNYLAINVFGWAGNRVIVRRISPVENPNTQRINLMLITQDKQLHYC